MSKTSRPRRAAAVAAGSFVALLAAAADPAAGQQRAINLDVGGTVDDDNSAGVGSGPIGPAHFDGTLNSSQGVWNGIAPAGATAGTLQYADGSAAAGVFVNVGAETGSITNTLNLNSAEVVVNRQGSGPEAYQNNAVVADYLRTSTTDFGLGLRVGGLPAGQYAVYAVAEDTFNPVMHANQSSFRIYAGAGAGGGPYNYSGFASEVLENTVTTGYAAGDNYARLLVTLAAGEDLLVVSDERSAGARQGQLNAVQIVPIPEPGAASAALCVACGLLMRRRGRAKL